MAALGDFGVYDLGGGLGCRYTYTDHPPALAEFLDVLTGARADGSFAFTTRDGRELGAYGQLGTFSEYTLVQQIRVLRYERDIPPQVAAVTSCGVITGYGSAVRAAWSTCKVAWLMS